MFGFLKKIFGSYTAEPKKDSAEQPVAPYKVEPPVVVTAPAAPVVEAPKKPAAIKAAAKKPAAKKAGEAKKPGAKKKTAK